MEVLHLVLITVDFRTLFLYKVILNLVYFSAIKHAHYVTSQFSQLAQDVESPSPPCT